MRVLGEARSRGAGLTAACGRRCARRRQGVGGTFRSGASWRGGVVAQVRGAASWEAFNELGGAVRLAGLGPWVRVVRGVARAA